MARGKWGLSVQGLFLGLGWGRELGMRNSKYLPGVKADPTREGWFVARIRIAGRDTTLGRFETQEEASAAYREAKAQAKLAKSADPSQPALTASQIIEIYDGEEFTPAPPRRIGERSPTAGIVFNSTVGKFHAKLRVDFGEWESLGFFLTQDEAAAAHERAYYDHRYAQQLRRQPETLEDAVVIGARIMASSKAPIDDGDMLEELADMFPGMTDEGPATLSADRFRYKLERWFPDLIDHTVPVAPLFKDQMIQERGNFRCVLKPEAEPQLIFG